MGPKTQRPPLRPIHQRTVMMDTNVRELALISVIACVGLALAWAHEADLFAICLSPPRASPLSKQLDDPCDAGRTASLLS
jgi:hypothetical protein